MPKRDINQLAKHIVDIATGEAPKPQVNGSKHPDQRLGGLKGGKARAEKLTSEQRKKIAQKAARKRWGKS